MPEPQRKVAILAYHPMPYHVAFYRAVHALGGVTETVLFLDSYGIRGRFDPEFATTVQWDRDLLTGYHHKFLRNFSPRPDTPFLMRINPGLFPEIIGGGYEAVVITGYDTPSAHFALIAAKVTGKKVLLRAEADLANPSTPWRRFLKRLFLRPFLSLCDAVLYSCERNRLYFRHFGVTEEKLFPILSAVDNDALRAMKKDSAEARRALRARMGIPDEAVVFLFSGRLIERKRPMDLLTAFTRLIRAYPQARLVFVGDGPLRRALEAEARAHDPGRIHFTGFKNLSEIFAHYMMADVFILTSAYDPTPKALNEAQVFGLPAIVSRGVGTSQDLISPGQNGLVFDTGDVAGLAAAMESLLKDAALRQRMGQAAQVRIEGWSPQAAAQGLSRALDYCFRKNRS